MCGRPARQWNNIGEESCTIQLKKGAGLAAEAVYLSLIAQYQSLYPVYTTNRGNLLFFVAAGLLLGVYMTHQKVSGIYSAYLTLRMDEIKQLNTELRKSREELRAALGAGMNGPLAKPLEIPKLLEALQQVLQ